MTEPFEQICPIQGEWFRFHVISRTRANIKHLVDLEEFEWSGGCSCEDFSFHHRPLLEDGHRPSDIVRCYHIKAARSYFLQEVLPKMAKALRGGDKTALFGSTPLQQCKSAVCNLRLGDLKTLARFIDDMIQERAA